MGNVAEVANEDATDCRIRLAYRLFYEQMEMRCKRFQPDHFAPSVVEIMRRYHEAKRWGLAPEFEVGLMIEANCAYTRGSNNDTLTRNSYARIHNIFHAFEDPGLAALIERDLGNFFLVLRRQQIELQRSVTIADIARYYGLFIAEAPLRRLGAEMKDQVGVAPEGWLKACLAVYATASTNKYYCAAVSPGCPSGDVDVDPQDVQVFLRHASYTPKQVGQRFKRLRKETRPKFHSCIRSVFTERPLIDFGKGNYHAPFPPLLFHFGAEGLYRRLLDLPSFSTEFGTVVQRYVERIAGYFPGVQLRLRDTQLENASRTKSCDVLLELPTHIILIESKTTAFSRNIITPSTIADDNSTRKIALALKQIYRTARDVRDGIFQGLGVFAQKPIWAVVTTFGDIPFANAPWYFERYLDPEANASEADRNLVSGRVVMSLHQLEMLAIVMKLTGSSLPDLFNRREQVGYSATGDWDVFLEKLAHDVKGEHLLPHVRSDFEAFFETLGVPRDRLYGVGTCSVAGV